MAYMSNRSAVRLANVVVGRSRAFLQIVRSAAASGSKEHIDGLVKSGQKVVVFMKGTPDAPRCGFSNAVIQILKMHGVDNFDAHNVLEDEYLRQGSLYHWHAMSTGRLGHRGALLQSKISRRMDVSAASKLPK